MLHIAVEALHGSHVFCLSSHVIRNLNWKYTLLKFHICIILMFLQCVSTMIIVYIIISPLDSYLYIHWILDVK